MRADDEAAPRSPASSQPAVGQGAKAPERIFLIGYRATGKTSLGRTLAGRLGYEFQDTDTLVEARLGMSIAEYFETHGEPGFREREAEVLELITSTRGVRTGMVVATGGGIVISEANVALMRRTGLVVWLTASVDTIRRRLEKDTGTSFHRPALRGTSAIDEVERVLKERLPLYRAAAHFEISTERGEQEWLVENLLKKLAGSRGSSDKDTL